jgi:hypothetical protein
MGSVKTLSDVGVSSKRHFAWPRNPERHFGYTHHTKRTNLRSLCLSRGLLVENWIQAIELAKSHNIDNFKGNPSWCYRSMKCNNLAIRQRTTIAQLPADHVEKLRQPLDYFFIDPIFMLCSHITTILFSTKLMVAD